MSVLPAEDVMMESNYEEYKEIAAAAEFRKCTNRRHTHKKDIQTHLSRRLQNQGPNLTPLQQHRPPQYHFHHGYHKRQRLPAARHGPDEDIVMRQKEGDGRGLNRRHGGEVVGRSGEEGEYGF